MQFNKHTFLKFGKNKYPNVMVNNDAETLEGTPEEQEKKQRRFRRRRFFVLLLIIIILLLLGLHSCNGAIDTPDIPGLEFEDDQAWDGKVSDEVKEEEESIEVPGYSDIYLSEKTTDVRFMNPENNTVYFIYTLTVDGEEIYQSKAIKPGNMVKINLYELIPKSSCELTIAVSTYDTETEEVCNGASQTVTVTKE